jgi:SAM-dependent methyltransferase
MRDAALHALGLVAGASNTLRHHLVGYRTPRPFSADDIERSADYAIDAVNSWTWWADLQPDGKRVLEIGPGPDLGTGATLVARGATRYVAVDRFPLAQGASPEFYAAMEQRLAAPVDVSKLEFVVTDFPTLPDVEGPFDIIVSNATLEHLDDVPGTFRRLAELAAPGAVMCHYVDAKAHMRWFREKDPLNILRYSDRVYRRLLSFPGAPNRLRASDFCRAAEAAGFSITVVSADVAPDDYLERLRPKLPPRWRSYRDEDLTLLDFVLVGRR